MKKTVLIEVTVAGLNKSMTDAELRGALQVSLDDGLLHECMKDGGFVWIKAGAPSKRGAEVEGERCGICGEAIKGEVVPDAECGDSCAEHHEVAV